jgi:hypothetical protein
MKKQTHKLLFFLLALFPLALGAAESAPSSPFFKPNARLQVDSGWVTHNDTAPKHHFTNGTTIRRFFVGATGKLSPSLSYHLLGGLSGDDFIMQDAYLKYHLAEQLTVLAA